MSPLRIYIPLALIVLFFLWVLYRLLIKKDLRQNLPAFYAGILFIAAWAMIYIFLLK